MATPQPVTARTRNVPRATGLPVSSKTTITSDPESSLGHLSGEALTLKAAGARIGVSRHTVRREVAAGKIAFCRVGPRGAIRIPVEAISRYLAASLVDPQAPKQTKSRRSTAGSL